MIKYLLPFLLLAGQAHATITTSFSASRTSGVAPLAVIFDASGTTSSTVSDEFSKLLYTVDFDDVGAGTWGQGNPNNNSKETDFGPITAHVFETAGTYTVGLSVSGDGTATDSVVITVTDPDTVFSGTNTVCISTSGTFTGCPSGASNITGSDFDGAINAYATAGKRVLFRRGETFTANDSGDINNDGPGIIGAYGTGAKPYVTQSAAVDLFALAGGSGGHTEDWRVMDLDLEATIAGTEAFRSDNTVEEFLILRVEAYNFERSVSINTGGIHYYASASNTNIFMVDNYFHEAQSHVVYVSSEGLVAMGNVMFNAPNSHVFRMSYVNPAVVSHNSIYGTTGATTHTMKLHAYDIGGDDHDYSPAYSGSGRFVIADNIITASGSSWAVALGAESASHNQEIKLGNVERNLFTAHNDTVSMLYLNTTDATVRNNLFEMAASNTGIGLVRRGIEPIPADNRIYNNTFYTSSNGSVIDEAIGIGSAPTGTIVRNNVLFSADGNGSVLTGSATSSNNNVTIGLAGGHADRFLPTAAEIDAGYATPVLLDYAACNRPDSTLWDIGAYEDGATCNTPAGPTIIEFPASPLDGDKHTPVNGREYQYNIGYGWGKSQ